MSLNKICLWFGISRQAYYQSLHDTTVSCIKEELIVKYVRGIKKDHSKMGARKIYELTQPFLAQNKIKMGRDGLFKILKNNKLLVRYRKSQIKTTNSNHRFKKYPNLIRNLVAKRPNEIWVSDITYWKIGHKKHLYISLITDAFSRKIVGYHLSESIETIEVIKALRMALSAFKGAESHSKLTHHSDRGIQYCSNEYVKLLQDNLVAISMTENGDPLENAIAERVNGIIKNEYLDGYDIDYFETAKTLLDHAIRLYNEERPHLSLNNKTPSLIHSEKSNSKIKRLWKNYYQNKRTIVNHEVY